MTINLTHVPEPGTEWKHDNGNRYWVIALCNEHADPQNASKYPVTVTYIGENGRIWSKELPNFIARMTYQGYDTHKKHVAKDLFELLRTRPEPIDEDNL